MAGGASSRFGGRPKGLHTVGGRRIVDRVADALRAMSPEIVVVSNAIDAASWIPGVRAVPDVRAERGSLVGIHTALTCAADDVFVVAWDMPFVTADLLGFIGERAQRAAFAVVPEGPSGLEPLCAWYSARALPFLTAAIDAGDFRLTSMLATLPSYDRIPLADVTRVGDPARLFFNVNTPNDLDTAERMAAQT